MARPRKHIDWEQFDKLCHIQCTLIEIACWFDCSIDTIENACKREKKMRFSEYYEQKAPKGRISLRRKMYEMALSGDRVMLIWLSKQYMGMSEKQDIRQESTVAMDFDKFKFVEPK